MNYIVILIIAILIGVFMYISNIKQINKDLRRQKQKLQTKIVQEKVKANIKEFETYQKAKKEEIKKNIKDKNEKKDVNLSVGPHIMEF